METKYSNRRKQEEENGESEEDDDPWKKCAHCPNVIFKTVSDFVGHLREKHSVVEGGSFVCRYGYNSVCNSLPVEGVSDSDYFHHVVKHHALLPVIPRYERGDSSETSGRKPSGSVGQPEPPLESDERWTLFSAKQNLATVLNDPNRGKQKDCFTKHWGPDFVEKTPDQVPKHPRLPDVDRSHFESYLKKIAKRHKRNSKPNEPESKSERSASSEILHAFPKVRLRKALADDRKIIGEKPEIASIFLRPDFEIGDRETFYTVFPFSKDDKPENETFRHNRRLTQEKLTHDLDLVEVSIAEQVSEKSDAFFQAVTSHDSLMDQLAKTLSVVRSLRQKIGSIDRCLARNSLRLFGLHQRKRNHAAVLQKLKLMGTVQQTQPTIQALLSAPDYLAALELIATTQELLGEELRGVHSFRHLGSQLNEINRLIDMMMTTEFENYLIRDLNRNFVADLPLSDREKLTSIMLGMLRRRNVRFVLKYKEETFATIRTRAKQLVFEALAENDSDVDGPYTTEKIHLLSLDERIELLHRITRDLIEFLRRVQAVVGIMKDSVALAAGRIPSAEGTSGENLSRAESGDETGFLSEKEAEALTTDLKELSTSVSNFCHDECAKILVALAKSKTPRERNQNKTTVKSEQTGVRTSAVSVSVFDDVDGKQIRRLSEIIEEFSSETEKLCSRSSSSLRSAFQHQANKFLNKFHNDRKSRINAALENESWRPGEVKTGFRDLLDDISCTGILRKRESSGGGSGSAENHLVVNEEKFVVVGSVLVLVESVVEYAEIARDLPFLFTNASRCLGELLSHYNSKSCQLVLGAGALQTVGLKTITTTNLVLTSRSLQLVLWLVPHIKNHFDDSHGGKPPGSDAQFTEIEANLKDHVNKLHAKVVLVVGSVITNEINNWGAKPPVPSSSFRNISNHLTKLHEAVRGILPPSQIEDLYKKIHDVFKATLREQLKKLNIVNNGGPQHGTVTSELIFYLETLKKLRVFSSENFSEGSLDDIWISR